MVVSLRQKTGASGWSMDKPETARTPPWRSAFQARRVYLGTLATKGGCYPRRHGGGQDVVYRCG